MSPIQAYICNWREVYVQYHMTTAKVMHALGRDVRKELLLQ